MHHVWFFFLSFSPPSTKTLQLSFPQEKLAPPLDPFSSCLPLRAAVRPLLKGSLNLDLDYAFNYYLVSLLPFFLKFVDLYLPREFANLAKPFQSAFKSRYTTEIALLNMADYLRRAAGGGQISV